MIALTMVNNRRTSVITAKVSNESVIEIPNVVRGRRA
jgi:hypothetical protein